MAPKLRNQLTRPINIVRLCNFQDVSSQILNRLMKAIVYHEYGSPDVLELKDIDKPVVNHDDVLVRVRAASVNPLDWHFMRGTPHIVRIMTGLLKPKITRPGVDVAGVVEAVGSNVTQFHAGDEVFGACKGAFAEYVCTSEGDLVLKPANVTFEQAAAVPVAAFTSLQGLRDKGQIQPGNKVLINGAAGGVGTFAVQIAKSFGAYVTGVCSTRNVDMVRSIGADHVIDYTQEDYTQSGQRYDLIFDTVGNHSLSDNRRVLGSKGALVMAGGPTDSLLGILLPPLKALVMSRFVSQTLVPFVARRRKEDLIIMQGLLEAGKVTPVIDRTYPLSEVPEAIRYLEEGHARGKVVITLEHK
jgi:NADPH:quinone reductase-like Zn-dependent oxidoreductase